MTNQSEIIERIAHRLRISGPMSSSDLQTFLGLSQPQVSRYLKQLSSSVLKIGGGKKAKYVHLREIPQIGYEVPIFCVSEKAKLEKIGTLCPIYPKGFYWKSEMAGQSRMFDDLPYFLNDMRPSGFLGRLIPKIYPEWKFPEDLRLWTPESTLRYLCNFGVDSIGNFVLGDISAQKFLQISIEGNKSREAETSLLEYEDIAKNVERCGVPGSSAGGEHPKFLTIRLEDKVPVLVKFVSVGNSDLTQRRIDLLRAENVATEILYSEVQAVTSRLIERQDYVFLEVERFDRKGRFGRKGVISLFSLDSEFIGSGGKWSTVARELLKLKLINDSMLEKIEFVEYFGDLIGNTDMHSGNLSFYFEKEEVIGLAPIYDMLPMKYSPVQDRISLESIVPAAPLPSSIKVWKKARDLAIEFWKEIQIRHGFSRTFTKIAQQNEKTLKSSNFS